MPRSRPLRVTSGAALGALALLATPTMVSAATLTFNSASADIGATRDAWLAAAGITAPMYLVDFES
ncbi:MAG: hypothetical protein RLW42_25965 [Gammaproteobacteria bacterium]